MAFVSVSEEASLQVDTISTTGVSLSRAHDKEKVRERESCFQVYHIHLLLASTHMLYTTLCNRLTSLHYQQAPAYTQSFSQIESQFSLMQLTFINILYIYTGQVHVLLLWFFFK